MYFSSHTIYVVITFIDAYEKANNGFRASWTLTRRRWLAERSWTKIRRLS